METRRERILAEGMRLFGEQGYAATSVAQIEQAAGLSPGSGSLYKHFRSKKDLLVAGLDQLLASGWRPPPRVPEGSTDTDAVLDAAVRSGFDRMAEDRDLNRVLFRGLAAFPELLQRFGVEEIRRIEQDTSRLLAGLADQRADRDWEAVATILQGATAHYWLLEDLYGGGHPTGISRERFIAALVSLAAGTLAPDPPD